MTDTLELTDTLTTLDFDPACEWVHGCAEPAAWVCVGMCCGRVLDILCGEHRLARDEFIAEALRQRCTVIHRSCGGDGSRVRWEPLRGGGDCRG